MKINTSFKRIKNVVYERIYVELSKFLLCAAVHFSFNVAFAIMYFKKAFTIELDYDNNKTTNNITESNTLCISSGSRENEKKTFVSLTPSLRRLLFYICSAVFVGKKGN